MPDLKIVVSDERKKELRNVNGFTEQNFLDRAAAQGWTDEEDKTILKRLWQSYDYFRKREQERVRGGEPARDSSRSEQMVSHIMDTKLDEKMPNESKTDMLKSFDDNGYMDQIREFRTMSDKYNNSGTHFNKRMHETFGQDKQNFFKKYFGSEQANAEGNNNNAEADVYYDRDDDSYDADDVTYNDKYLDTDEDFALADTCYDAIFDKNGNYSEEIKEAVNDVGGAGNKRTYYNNILKAISNIPEENRSDIQNKAIEGLNNMITHDIPLAEKAKKWSDKVSGKKYSGDIANLLPKLYMVTDNLPEDHPYMKVLKELEEGKVPEYPEINSENVSFLVMDTALKHAKAELEKLPETKAKKNALEAIEDYNAPYLLNGAEKERKYYPVFIKFLSFTDELKEKVRNTYEVLSNDKNASGNGETKPYTDMLKAMRDFSRTRFDNINMGSMGDTSARNAMNAMEDSIIAYAKSEKDNPLNAAVPVALGTLGFVNKEKATDMRAQIAANILTELNSVRKEWYDSRDTTTYTNFKSALERLSKATDVNSEEYKNAIKDVKDYSKTYLENRNLGKKAWEKAGEVRKQMALVAYSLVEPEEAAQMLEEANKARKTESKKINFEELKNKVESGIKAGSKVNIEEAEAYVKQKQQERQAEKDKSWEDYLQAGEKSHDHEDKVLEKRKKRTEARDKKIANIAEETDLKWNPNAKKKGGSVLS